MSSSAEFELVGVEELVRKLDRMGPALLADLQGDMSKGALDIQGDARNKIRDEALDTGHLMQTLTVKRAGEWEWSIGSPLEYAGPVEFGTGPHFPPPDALAGWARRHGMAGLEYVIARQIARRGLPPRPFLLPSFTHNVDRIEAHLRATLARWAANG
jgi:hypothetical protein